MMTGAGAPDHVCERIKVKNHARDRMNETYEPSAYRKSAIRACPDKKDSTARNRQMAGQHAPGHGVTSGLLGQRIISASKTDVSPAFESMTIIAFTH